MKSRNGLENDAAPVKRQRSLARRALKVTFETLVILAGLDTVFPNVKVWITPESWSSVLQPANNIVSLEPKPFDWSQLEPKDNLEFHDCNDGFQCAKLSLPFDYFNGTHPNATVSIAITKLSARVSVDDPRYGGPILINPGGPGGPGALFALLAGRSLQMVTDPGSSPADLPHEAKFYDILGFDPRGIGMSEPAAVCIPSVPSSWSWGLRESNEGILGSSDAALGRLWSMTHAYGSSCEKALEDEDGPDIKEYMSTASVARDMLEITEKHAEYVAEQRAQLAAQKAGKTLGCHDTGYRRGEAKLQYWGFSYGTFLGTTFASMFPDRVGRVVLDGVVSVNDYMNSLGNGSLTDGEKAMDSFYTFCHNAGPSGCALATPGGNATTVKDRAQKIIKSLYHAPLPISTPHGPEVLTYSDIKLLIFSSTYTPFATFQYIGAILAAVEAGGSHALDFLVDSNPFQHVYSCPINGTIPSYTDNPDPSVSMTAILCSDGFDQTQTSISEFEQYWQDMETKYPTGGSWWSMLKMRCAAWPIRAGYAFRGPFGTNTSQPVLFVSNTADPVTPLRSGRLMHSLFPNSGLLITDGAGHCSLSASNECTLTHIRNYFQTGGLPKNETLCLPEKNRWSLNSTDPDSPFYNPSLETAELVQVEGVDERTEEQHALYAVGARLMDMVAGNDVFGFPTLAGSTLAKSLLRNIHV
ncbi:hypothetical protein NX059_003943 [Plenodomus lindquistii]|nr:hypothetical protein NX059_003943 [Plenodomus lindquistii]